MDGTAALRTQELDFAAAEDAEGGRGIEQIVRDFEELPQQARTAKISRLDERVLSRSLLDTLLNQPAPGNAVDWPARIEKRRQKLEPYLGRLLTCIFIRLPGVYFTIEVDPHTEAIVHWEWAPG